MGRCGGSSGHAFALAGALLAIIASVGAASAQRPSLAPLDVHGRFVTSGMTAALSDPNTCWVVEHRSAPNVGPQDPPWQQSGGVQPGGPSLVQSLDNATLPQSRSGKPYFDVSERFDGPNTQLTITSNVEVRGNYDHFEEWRWRRVPCPEPTAATFYGGFYLVKSIQRLNARESLASTGETTFTSSDSHDPVGAGITFGAMLRPFGNSVALSPFLSFEYLNMAVNHTFPGGSYLGTTSNWAGTAGVKIGPELATGLWLYGIAGVSVLNEKLNVNFIPVASSRTTTVPGGTVGVGAAFQPRFLQGFALPVSLFAESQHTWWGDATFNAPPASPAFNYNFRREDDAFKFGFLVAFGAQPAPAAPPSYPVKALPAK